VKLVVTGVRGPRTGWADDACADYGKRIHRYFPFEEVRFKPGTPAQEAERLFAVVPPRGWLIVLDERGEAKDSLQLAALLESGAREGATSLVFALGGAYGHDEAVRGRARLVLSLSRLVLNHAVARVVMVEQIYRACTIRAGEPYHHGG
jgi:23S rRNA (pseudouridine1915-N3)-methyltransferase